MEISNPRRILVIGAPDSGILPFLKDLTGTAPTPTGPDASLAGLTHSWTLRTAYYAATLPVWIDEIGDLPAWRAEFLKPEAREVVAAVGGWVLVLRKPVDAAARRDALAAMRAVRDVVERAEGLGWDGVCLAVAVGSGVVATAGEVVGRAEGEEELEDGAQDCGFEYVDAEKKGERNEFGEKVGMERVREALEANDWEGGGGEEADFEDFEAGLGSDDDDGDWGKTFAAEEAEMGVELMGLKTELNGGEEDEEDEAAQVEELERMMSKLSGIRDMAAGMPEEQRKKFAAKAVNDLMKSP
ncbi:hypothetical protein GTA08_BOTSDO04110 [Neofusicoccum parvum]|uniref:Uncharacterized protein n=1 Tax=Neofusicoccum parvum TaxID=310453 RepID=A0ACB5S5Z6_9PEZI|nr:hypothetical protein GTA08_BOTSDO04110 [Neofusicoccum parvum]